MAADIPENYPSGLSDNELVQTVKTYAKYSWTGHGYSFEFWSNMCQLGQNELTLRSQMRFVAETENLTSKMDELNGEISALRASNDRFGRISTRLSRVTIGLAIVTVSLAIITIWYSQLDMESDQTWRKDQMTELKEHNRLLQEQIRINEEINANYIELLEKPETLDDTESGQNAID